MRIVIPVFGFAKSGGFRVISRLASEWIDAGHEVVIASYYKSKDIYYSTSAKVFWYDEAGREVENCTNSTSEFSLPRAMLAMLRVLNKHFASFDIIIANHNTTAWPVHFSTSSAHKVYYIQAYEPEYYFPKRSLKQSTLFLLAYASYWLPLVRIVNSPVYREYRNLKARYIILPGIDLKNFYPPHTPREDGFTVGFVGRSEQSKGTKYAVEAIKILVTEIHQLRVRVALGEGIKEEDIEKWGIEVVAIANDHQLADFYRTLNVLLAPVIDQIGAPHYPVMEAMACGVAVVSTGHLPATRENAWIVPIKDPCAIAKATREVLNDSKMTEEKVRNGLRDIVKYEWHFVAQKMLDIFEIETKK